MDSSGKVRRMPCPRPAVWAELAAGVVDGAEAESLALHASECPVCAEALRSAVDALATDADDDSEASTLPGGLDASALARRMAEDRRARWPRFAAGFAAALLVATGTWFLWNRQNAAPLAELARAYSNPRTLEYRIDGASHAPLSVVRGRRSSQLPAELLENQAKILKVLSGGGGDAAWLHAKGRAELLAGDPEGAVRSLQAAADLGAESAGFWIDFGLAYATRGDVNGAAIDYTRAIEHFSAALKLEPRNPSALFDRAIVQSRLSLLDAAIRDLEACLASEHEAGWRAEARKLLDELRSKRSAAFDEVWNTPAPLRAETALQQALQEGIGPPLGRGPAVELRELHGDPWLAEALETPRTAVSGRAIALLAGLATIRSKSRREEYSQREPDLAWLRTAPLAAPLAAWAGFELLAAESNRSVQGPCADRERKLTASIPRRYRWLSIQAALELSTCFSTQGDLDRADQWTQQAMGSAEQAGFAIALARARGFHASHLTNEGRYREAVEITASTLAAIITRQYPLDRAHQFYRNLSTAAENLERWHTAEAASEMAVVVARHAGLRTLEVMSLLMWAEHALRSGNRAAASAHLVEAEQAAARIEADADVNLYRGYSAAMIQAIEGDLAKALAVEQPVLAGHNLFLDAPYLIQLAGLELRLSQPEAAARHAEEAIRRLRVEAANSRRFRQYFAEASRLLVRAQLARHNHPAALATWREWFRQDRDLVAGRQISAPHQSSADTTVSIVPLGDAAGVFAEESGALEFHWAALTANESLALIRRLRALCSDFRSDPAMIAATASKLASGLLGPRPVRQGGRVRIQTLGEWATIPLLVLEAEGPFSYFAPGGPREPCGRRFRGELAVAQAAEIAGEFRSSLPRLPSLAREAQLLRASVPGLTLLPGATLTPRAFGQAAADYRWLHFSGHAVRWRGAPVLVMAADANGQAELESRGLFALRPQQPVCSELIFFAACSSADFQEIDTVAPAQLADAAILAGARVAVAALWDVDSEATTELAGHFYTALAAGRSPSESLAQAARRLRANPRYRHPYYWGAFVLFEA